jgi:amino acid transporter
MSSTKSQQAAKFGTFLGVYTPSILTILGLIMYLRFGWVLGNVGLGLTILIVLMASSITFITGLSASAIATNIEVGVGGEYFLVSRSLGLEPGGAIGIPLYLCRTLSVTFYSFGLAEAILIFWPQQWGDLPSWGIQAFAAIIIILVTLLSGKSAKLVLKSQILIMVLVALSLLALFIGVFSNELRAPEMTPTYRTAPEGFWYVFAVFFPAVTGFTAGVGMSGDLKNPGKSIPKGTLGAVITGALIYIIIPVVLSVSAILTFEEMADPNLGVNTWTKLAFLGGLLIYPAVWGAILSSGFGSILGGPRVLQALSMDGLAPKFLSKLSKSGQPTTATWISGAIALLAVSLGELNTVAQYVSVLFLTLYVAINLSAAIERLVKEPSYRPKIKVPWFISLLGAIAAIVVMYLINPIACFFALGLELLLLIWLQSRSLEQQWGDVAAGFWLKIARFSLLQLNARKITARNWRPLMLIFVRDIKDRLQLIKMANLIGHQHGILSIAQLVLDKSDEAYAKRDALKSEMMRSLKEENIDAFCEVNMAASVEEGIFETSKSHGLAGLKTNTILFGWSEERENQRRQLISIRPLAKLRKNILICRFRDDMPVESGRKIDIWWGGRENNGDLMLLLAYLIRLNRGWEKAAITIRSVVATERERSVLEKGIREILPKARVSAKLEILIQKNESFQDILQLYSKDADLVLLGLAKAKEGEEEASAQKIDALTKKLKASILVQNNGMPGSVPILLKLKD